MEEQRTTTRENQHADGSVANSKDAPQKKESQNHSALQCRWTLQNQSLIGLQNMKVNFFYLLRIFYTLRMLLVRLRKHEGGEIFQIIDEKHHGSNL